MMNRAGFGVRLGASIIDVVALGIVYFVVNAIFRSRFTPDDFESLDKIVAIYLAGARRVALAGGLVWLAYSATEILKAASPGKMLLGLKIVGETGGDATRAELLKRWAIKWSPSLVGLLWAVKGMAGFHWIQAVAVGAFVAGCFFALGAKRQALHDRVTHTAIGCTGRGVLPAKLQGQFGPAQSASPAGTQVAAPPPPPAQAA
jgi:uncharacterized RDD family membrane protein YckC